MIFSCKEAHVVRDRVPLDSDTADTIELDPIQNIDKFDSEVSEALPATNFCIG